ncbi:hypothetical protein T01_5210 [Trichinella spiralis]|uniref:DUF7041 domain-containing protein n=1 Tax=Trichinella spiralis TaxID=6334 RepID=A0A0V1BCK4_TRISP|nr:hypothetical protein T01_5210 [Trichinella spiralis]
MCVFCVRSSKRCTQQLVTRMSVKQDNLDIETVAISVKLLPFWPHSPRLWFAQAEAQFALQHVSASVIKYYYVIASLPDSVGPDVNDLLEPAGDPPYETLKRRLLERYGESDDNRFNALMNSALAGDTKSSQLLREMR